MPTAVPQSLSDPEDDVLVVSVDGTWLRSNRLRVGLAKPPSAACTLEVIRNDLPRNEAMTLAQAIFDGAVPPMNLADDFNHEPGVVVFPEYAFGSGQFTALNALVKKQTMPLIVMAGFGATLGAKLKEQIEAGLFLAGWSGTRQPVADKRYNGAWVWVHQPLGVTQAYLVLKHRPAQRMEKYQIPGLGEGFGRLVLALDGIVMLPLLCSDFVLDQLHSDSAHRRVRRILEDTKWDGRKKIVLGSIFESEPSHDLWKQAISGLVTNAPDSAIIICNHESPQPHAVEASDSFRCGSGFWLGGRPQPRRKVYPWHIRQVDDANRAYSGLVVRDDCSGVTLGRVGWTMDANQFFAFEVTRRARFWNGGVSFVPDDHCPHYEIARWLARVSLADGPTKSAPHPWLVQQVVALTGKVSAGTQHERLWPGIEVGPLNLSDRPIIDEVAAVSSNDARSVRSGLRAIAAVLGVPGANLIAAPLVSGAGEVGQISFTSAIPASPRRFVSVWTPSTLSSAQIDETILQCATNFSVMNAVLVVVADSHDGVVKEGPIRPKPLPGQKRAAGLLIADGVVPERGDFDAEPPSEEEGDIRQPHCAPVFAIDYRKLENLFRKPATQPISAEVTELITKDWN